MKGKLKKRGDNKNYDSGKKTFILMIMIIMIIKIITQTIATAATTIQV